jgi:hypothetical protein
MRKSTLLIISILAMLLLAGSLMGFTATIHINTNYEGQAYIEIWDAFEIIERIPCQQGTFLIIPNSINTQYSGYLNPDHIGYTAIIYAHRYVGNRLIQDTDSHNFTYGTANFTLYVDLSGNGAIPNKPPIQP